MDLLLELCGVYASSIHWEGEKWNGHFYIEDLMFLGDLTLENGFRLI